MNYKVHVDEAVFRILYYKYKDYIIPVSIFAISLIIFMQVLLPQFENFLAQKDQIAASEQTIAVMTQNYNSIISQKDTDLDKFLGIANTALPQDKDFAGILTAISNAAGLSGVTLNDYAFQIGDLTGTKTLPQNQDSLKVNLVINGSLEQAKAFITALQHQMPISEVTDIEVSSASTATINTDFFYSPLGRNSFDDTTPIKMVSSSEKKILEDLGANINTAPVAPSVPMVTPISSLSLPTPTSQISLTPIPLISPTTSAGSASAAQL